MFKKIEPVMLRHEGVEIFNRNNSKYKFATIELVPITELIKQIRIVAVQAMFSILDKMGHGDKYNADTFKMSDFDTFAKYTDGVAEYVCNSVNEIDLYFKFYDPEEYTKEGIEDYLHHRLYMRYEKSLLDGFKYYERYSPEKYTEIDVGGASSTEARIDMAAYLNKGLQRGTIISSKTNPNKPSKKSMNPYESFLKSDFGSDISAILMPTDFYIDSNGNAPMTHFLEAFISPDIINDMMQISGFVEKELEEVEEQLDFLRENVEDGEDTEIGEIKINTLSERENLLIELKHIFTTDFPGALSTYEEIKHKSTDQLKVIYNTLKGEN